nr:MAG TPA: hypothetical protein [Caudoviricetes sp.]
MLFCPKPKVISIDSIPVPVDPDFRIMCDYSEAMSDKDADKACALAGRFYFAGLPEGVSEKAAADAMTDFYISGLAPGARNKGTSAMGSHEPSFDFSEDEAYFYADFLGHYGIDLSTAKLHWFDFCALFRGLPDECRLKRIIGIRAESLSEIKSSAERSRVSRLKCIFALKKKQAPRYKTAAERDRAVLDEIQRIHREATERMRGEGR